MGNENVDEETWQQKLLFYTTAFFVLLGTFSLFSFLFLVPFVIDPAFTTIFKEFDEKPAFCVTVKIQRLLGASNCNWTSCREGCTKDIYDCTQIYVTYKVLSNNTNSYNYLNDSSISSNFLEQLPTLETPYVSRKKFNYDNDDDDDDDDEAEAEEEEEEEDLNDNGIDSSNSYKGLQPNTSEWHYKEARLMPNVKGCGYPPMLNCSVWLKTYIKLGTNFSCYYSKIDPELVISDLDMWQVYMNLVYAMCIPIPSFIISVIYLAIAYFKIYIDDEESAPLEKNAEAIDVDGEGAENDDDDDDDNDDDQILSQTPIPTTGSGGLTPASEAFREDLASFGHHFKVAMVDDILSRDSLVDGMMITSVSITGSIGKTMTTSISITGGPVADI